MVSRRELENTRIDLRRWSKQLLELSAEVAERANELETAGQKGETGGAEPEGTAGNRDR